MKDATTARGSSVNRPATPASARWPAIFPGPHSLTVYASTGTPRTAAFRPRRTPRSAGRPAAKIGRAPRPEGRGGDVIGVGPEAADVIRRPMQRRRREDARRHLGPARRGASDLGVVERRDEHPIRDARAARRSASTASSRAKSPSWPDLISTFASQSRSAVSARASSSVGTRTSARGELRRSRPRRAARASRRPGRPRAAGRIDEPRAGVEPADLVEGELGREVAEVGPRVVREGPRDVGRPDEAGVVEEDRHAVAA